MTAYKIIQKPKDGRITIEVPEELQDQTLVITFEPETQNTPALDESKLSEEGRRRLAILRQFKGIFPKDGYEPTETEWYEQ